MINIILCGGVGSRLWPLSDQKHPKQFLKIFNDQSLFQKTVIRNEKLTKHFFLITTVKQHDILKDQLKDLPIDNQYTVFLEPIGRNTAPAIALACMKMSEDDIVLVTPSDHIIKNEAEYFKAVMRARELASDDKIVTFGITPVSPETGYGYIQHENENVLRFCEKPELEVAKEFLKSGNFVWNSGMFCFKAGVYLQELKKYAPMIHSACLDALAGENNALNTVSYEAMMKIPDDSIDYAVLEHSDRVRVVKCDLGWSDLGSFDALYENFEKDQNLNSSNIEAVVLDSYRNLLVSSSKKIIALSGIEDLIVIETQEALLIIKRGESQNVKSIVQQLPLNYLKEMK